MSACNCVFCDKTFPDLHKLCVHLFGDHPHMKGTFGDVTWLFYRYSRPGRAKVNCFCGCRFTCHDTLETVIPFFRGMTTQSVQTTTDSFIAHLRREGGLEKHFNTVRANAFLDKIARSAGEVFIPDEDKPGYRDMMRGLGHQLNAIASNLRLDKIANLGVESTASEEDNDHGQ